MIILFLLMHSKVFFKNSIAYLCVIIHISSTRVNLSNQVHNQHQTFTGFLHFIKKMRQLNTNDKSMYHLHKTNHHKI